MAYYEQGCGFHVDADDRKPGQALMESTVPFSYSAVGGVDYPRTVFLLVLDQSVRNKFMEFEGRQGWYFGREVIVAGTFAADGRNGKNETANLGGTFHPSAFAEKEHPAGCCADSRSMIVATLADPIPKLMIVNPPLLVKVYIGAPCPLIGLSNRSTKLIR